MSKRNLPNRVKTLFESDERLSQKNTETKTLKLCEVTGVSKSTFYYNRNNNLQEKKDEEIPAMLKKFPKNYYKQQMENKKSLPKNVLNLNFTVTEPLKKLCTDVSYFRTTAGRLYLSPVLDLHRRQVVAYSVSMHNDENLVNDTLDKLFSLGVLTVSLLHSDQVDQENRSSPLIQAFCKAFLRFFSCPRISSSQ